MSKLLNSSSKKHVHKLLELEISYKIKVEYASEKSII